MKSGLLRYLSIVLTALLALTACGLSLDASPREISSQDLDGELRPGQLPTPTPMPASESGPGREQIHMIEEGNRLVTVQRQIVDTPEQLVDILLQGTFPVEAADGIESAIPRGTEVQSIEVNELFDLAIVDLKPGSLNSGNTEQRLAFAQIVYTLTALPGIEAVQFVRSDPDEPDAERVDLPVQTDAGTTLPGARVTRDDFSLLSPSNAALPTFDIPIATPTPIPDPDAPPMFESTIWMVDQNDQLARVTRTIEQTPNAYLVAVLEGVLAKDGEDIRSALPPDALANPIEVFERTVDFGFGPVETLQTAIVDFEPGSLPAVTAQDERFLAVAQIVFTLTQLEGIDQVVLSVDGIFIPMPIDGDEVTLPSPFEPSLTRGVDRRDYQTALPMADRDAVPSTSPPAPPPPPTATSDTGAGTGTEPGTESGPAPTPTPTPESTPTPTPTPTS